MTTASSIITDAYREAQIVPITGTPTALEIVEALGRLNNLILSTIGNEAGNDFFDLIIGGTYDQSSCCSPWIPEDTRLVLNLTGTKTLYLHPDPTNGTRFSIVDNARNLATYNLVLNGNGRRIEDSNTLTLNTNGAASQWMYRSDLGNWVKILSLVALDGMPFPAEFDDYFITTLAMRLAPRNSVEIQPATIEALKRSRSQLRARYNKPRQMRSDVDTNNGLAIRTGINFTGIDNFNTGKPWPYL